MAAAKKRARDPHPAEELARLERALGSDLPPAVVLRGEERHFRDRGARLVVAAARQRGLELCRHDAEDPEFSLAALLDDLGGGALFAHGRCVHLERADGLLKKGGRGHSPALTPALVARLASAEPGTIVIGADSLRVDHPVVKAVEGAGGLVVRCRRLWDTPPPWDADPRRAELVQWLLTEARGRGVALTPDEALYVTAATGNDLAALLDRLEDLRHRGRAAVGEVVGWDAGGSPWELAERLVDGDVRRGAPGVEALFRSGFRERDGSRRLEPATLTALLVGALSGKVREAALGAAALAGGGAPAAAAALAGVKGPPRALEAYRARLGRRPAGDWRRMQLEVADLERRSKSGALVDASDFALLALRWALRR